MKVLTTWRGAANTSALRYFDPKSRTPTILKRGGQRAASCDVPSGAGQGGARPFRTVHLEIARPHAATGVFRYELPHRTRTLHAAAPVRVGENEIATKWLRERRFCNGGVQFKATASHRGRGHSADAAGRSRVLRSWAGNAGS